MSFRKKVICFSIILGLLLPSFHTHLEHEHNIIESDEHNGCVICYNQGRIISTAIQMAQIQSWHMIEALTIGIQQSYYQYSWYKSGTRAPPLMG